MANREIFNDSTTNCVTSMHRNLNRQNHVDFSAKLRRLKIEESVLTENLNKIAVIGPQIDGERNQIHDLTYVEFKKFAIAIRKSYNDLKQLFEDIKACTSSKDHIMSVDIDDLKKNIFDLENNMKSFKLYLFKELSSLKTAEKDLNVKLKDPISKSYLKARPTTQTMKYIELVSSPVKATMNSPFKCSEVQAFQEFMSLSKNRYGGWAEYHHNIFVNMWQKYLDTEFSIVSDEAISAVINSTEFKLFADELVPKLEGLGVEEIVSHAKWFICYLHLKYRQQQAIEKWRSTRRFMKPNVGNNVEISSSKNRVIKMKKRTNETDNVNSSDKVDSKNKTGCYARKCLSDVIQQNSTSSNPNSILNHSIKDDQVPNFLKLTKQWSIRRSSNEYKSVNEVNNIENVKKLRVPLWRANL